MPKTAPKKAARAKAAGTETRGPAPLAAGGGASPASDLAMSAAAVPAGLRTDLPAIKGRSRANSAPGRLDEGSDTVAMFRTEERANNPAAGEFSRMEPDGDSFVINNGQADPNRKGDRTFYPSFHDDSHAQVFAQEGFAKGKYKDPVIRQVDVTAAQYKALHSEAVLQSEGKGRVHLVDPTKSHDAYEVPGGGQLDALREGLVPGTGKTLEPDLDLPTSPAGDLATRPGQLPRAAARQNKQNRVQTTDALREDG